MPQLLGVAAALAALAAWPAGAEQPQDVSFSLFSEEGRPKALLANISLPSALLEERADNVQQPRICGSREIGAMLLLYSKPDKFMFSNINWGSTYQMMDDYISRQSSKVTEMTAQLQAEEGKLKAATPFGLDSKPLLSRSVVQSLLEQAVRAGFGGASVTAVRQGKCGLDMAPQSGASAQDDPFDASRKAFSKLMEQALKGSLRTRPGEVGQVCRALLIDTPEDAGFCDKLCLSFDGTAEEWSRTAQQDAGPSFGTITKRMDDIKRDIGIAQAEVETCSSKRHEMMDWGKQMTQYSESFNSQFKLEREVRRKLDAVSSSIHAICQELNVQREKTAASVDQLSAEQAGVSTLTTQATQMMADLQVLAEQAARADKSVQTMRDHVKTSGAAFRAITSFKAALETMMRTLVEIYDTSVPKPLRELGLVDALQKVDAVAWPEPKCTFLSSQAPTSDSSSLQGACEAAADKTSKAIAKCVKQEGVEAFRQDKLATLDGLCTKDGKWQRYADDIERITSERRRFVLDALQELRGVVEDVSCAGEAELVAKGEPECFQKILRVFGESKFYKDYVSLWSVKAGVDTIDGPAVVLLRQMGSASDQFKELEQQARDDVKAVGDRHVALLQSLSDLRAKLTQALSAQRQDEAAVRQAKQMEADSQAHEDQLKSMQALLEENLKTATQLWKQAVAEMTKLHSDMQAELTKGPEEKPEQVVVLASASDGEVGRGNATLDSIGGVDTVGNTSGDASFGGGKLHLNISIKVTNGPLQDSILQGSPASGEGKTLISLGQRSQQDKAGHLRRQAAASQEAATSDSRPGPGIRSHAANS